MRLKEKIKRLERVLRSERLDFSKLSDAELEAIAGRNTRFAAFLQTLSDAELEAIRDNNLAAVSTETLEKMKNVYLAENQTN